MPANVEVLIPNDRTRAALGSIRSARFTTKLSSAGPKLLVARLADLEKAKGRRELEDLCDTVKSDVPIVFMLAKAEPPRSGAAFQALAHLIWLVGREVYIAPDPSAVGRMVFARQAKAESTLIASAAVEDGKLIVWSCEPRRFAVSASEIPALSKMTREALADFEVSETGSRIHWNDGDVDLNLDVIRAYADPDVRRKHEAERRQEAARYAGAIRKLREERGIRQAGIAGLSERQVRRLEEGQTLPHSATLKKLAAAHGMAVEDYLRELAKRSSRRSARLHRARPARGRAASRRS